jgi:hypothetical protein
MKIWKIVWTLSLLCIPLEGCSSKPGGGPDAGPDNLLPAPAPLRIVTDTLLAGQIGLPYHDTLKSSGAEPPVTWSIADAGTDVTNWLTLD